MVERRARTSRHGSSQPEADRYRKVFSVRLRPDAISALYRQAAEHDMKISEFVEYMAEALDA